MSVDEVADWITHAVQLPQYRDAFVANSITGYDFPALLENTGESLRLDLGVTNKLVQPPLLHSTNPLASAPSSRQTPVVAASAPSTDHAGCSHEAAGHR